MDHFFESFQTLPASPWRRAVVGSADLRLTGSTLRLIKHATTDVRYTNAQIDDYQRLSRRRFCWRPPLTLTVRARFSHGPERLVGTAGFGFWNSPWPESGRRLPALPRALWFFYSSVPSNMALAQGVTGPGWKAATVDARRPLFLCLAPAAPLAMPLMRIPGLYRRLWPIGQRAIGVAEAPLTVDMTAWHTYAIGWGRDQANFWVDGHLVLASSASPGGPLGLVIWLDNQYLIVTPQGHFGHGLLASTGTNWLELDWLALRAG